MIQNKQKNSDSISIENLDEVRIEESINNEVPTKRNKQRNKSQPDIMYLNPKKPVTVSNESKSQQEYSMVNDSFIEMREESKELPK